MRLAIFSFALWIGCSWNPRSVAGQVVQDTVADLKGIDVVEHLGDSIPGELSFYDSRGEMVTLSHFLHRGKPIILSLYYTNCPMLCSLVLSGLVKAVNGLSWTAGEEFTMLSVSLDPQETPQLAAATKEHYAGMLKRTASTDAWEFLISPQNRTKELAEALGFQYYYVPERRQFAHPAVIFVLTDAGIISRYIYGINFKSQDLRLALLEASQGRIGNTVDRILLFCFHYNPEAKGYVLWAANIMKFGGAASLLIMGLFLALLFRKSERRRRRAA